MSFVGVTFAEQKVSPSDDAILMKAILDDGIIYGCGLNYAGFALTMDAGYLLISGRLIHNTAAQTWAIAGATSGYARLVLTIDLSLPSTADDFQQVEASVEYSTTSDGFASLEQSEINVSGVKYQVEICAVSLSSGGITGIVRQISEKVLAGVLPIANGGTGATTVAAAREALGLGNTSGALPIANGGTGATTVAAARNALGLGNTSGALPIANGGTGATTVAAARNALGLGNTSGALPIANGGTGATGGQAGLKNLLAAGYMVASSYQIVSSVSAIPSGAPTNAIFFVPMED